MLACRNFGISGVSGSILSSVLSAPVSDKPILKKTGLGQDISINLNKEKIGRRSFVSLDSLKGTHSHIAKSGGDKENETAFSVEVLADKIARDITLLNTAAYLTLDVFESTIPGSRIDSNKFLWSLNNRRLRAIQLAVEKIGSDPKKIQICVNYVDLPRIEIGIKGSRFANDTRQVAAYHSPSSNTQRFDRSSQMTSPVKLHFKSGRASKSTLSRKEHNKIQDLAALISACSEYGPFSPVKPSPGTTRSLRKALADLKNHPQLKEIQQHIRF